MGTLSNIHNAFTKKLNSLSGLPTVIWENTDKKPVKGSKHLVPHLMFGKTRLLNMQSDQEYLGLFQIDIYIPLDNGAKELTTMMDSLSTHFRGVNSLTESSTVVYIREVSPGKNFGREDAWYRGMIEVYFDCND